VTSSAATWTLWTGACALAACNALVGNTDVHLAESDASTADGTTDDATGNTDGAEAGPDGPATVYNDVTLPANWSTFDLNGLGSAYSGFVGGAFDGRYVYLSPNQSDVVVQYDTTAPFANAASWAAFHSQNVDPNTGSFGGATFAAHFVYFPPEQQSTVTTDAGSYSVYAGVLARYDPSGPFDAASSWVTFDMTAIDPNAVGYVGAAFDGTYLYFSQHEGNPYDGLVSRYDTRGQLDAGSSWQTYPTGSPEAGEPTTGAVFDGQHLYFGADDPGQGQMQQYDTTGPFNAAGSWAAFDQSTLNGGAYGYVGQAFDGRYVYFVPRVNNTGPHGLALLYDPKVAFTAASSWKLFDTAILAPQAVGFAGAAFDGRYLYFAPNSYSTLVRFDTTKSFTDTAAWTAFDVTKVSAGATGFFGAIFDGRYVYLVPNAGTVVLRFDAKTPASMPPGYSGSFL
jgi:hypothetical protein